MRGVTIRIGVEGVKVETPVAEEIRYEVTSVSPFDKRLDYWASNPAVRRKRSMEELRHSIRSVGRVLVPLAVIETPRGTWHLASGNRRLLIARELELRSIPLLLVRGIKAQFWAAIEATTGRPWKVIESAMLAVNHPDAIRVMSKTTQRKIAAMRDLLGEEFSRFVHDNPRNAPNIVYWIGRACRENGQDKPGFILRAVLWAEGQIRSGRLNLGQLQLAVRIGGGAMKDFVPAVMQDRPMRFPTFSSGRGV